MTQINFIDKKHKIILTNCISPYFDHDGIDIGKVYELLEAIKIEKILNKIMVDVYLDSKDIDNQIHEFEYISKKYLNEDESKILISKMEKGKGKVIVPLKLALLFDIWSGFANILYQPRILGDSSDELKKEYEEFSFHIADVYTMIFCKGYNQRHYTLDKWLYWEIKEKFGKLDNLDIREQQKERKLLKKFCSFLEELDSIEETEEKNLLGMKISKKNFKTILEKGKGRISPYDTVLFLRIFTDIKPILCLVKNGLHSLKLLPYEISLYGEKSLYNNIILKRKDCSIFSPFREFQTPVNKELEERNKLNEHLSNSSSSKTHCNEILDKCIKDIEKCARIGANRLEIKFNNHVPTEMTHFLSVGKSANNIGEIKDYILNEGGGPSHFGSTTIGGSKVAFEGRKKYSYKKNGKIP